MILLADHDRISRLISSVRSALRLLTELAGLDRKVFLGDEHKISSAKYNFIAAIEAVIDINNHLISRNKLRAPEDYADSFAVLCEASVLERPFADELMKMARFRNRLVHLYWDVDPEELHTITQSRLRISLRIIYVFFVYTVMKSRLAGVRDSYSTKRFFLCTI